MREVHEGLWGSHIGRRSFARKLICRFFMANYDKKK